MSEISHRNLTPADIDQIIDIWHRADLPFRVEGRDSRENLTREIETHPEFFYGAFDGNKMVGVVIGTFDGRKGCVNRLAVLPQYRRLGIAQKLIDLCEGNLRSAGATVIWCLIYRDNPVSIELFEKMGYSAAPDILYLSKRDNPDA